MNTISIEDIKKLMADNDVVYIKYVRIDNDYRFALDAHWSTPNHSQMVGSYEIAESAGAFKLYRDRFEWETTWSVTLQIGIAKDDEEKLRELFYGGK